MDNTKLAAEVVKLKQEVAELRATVNDLLKDHDGNYSPTLKPLDDGWGHAEDGWPWDVSVTDSITVPKCNCEQERKSGPTTGGWHCPLHGNVFCCRDYEVSFQAEG